MKNKEMQIKSLMKNEMVKQIMLISVLLFSITLSLIILDFVITYIVNYTQVYYSAISSVDTKLNIFNILWIFIPLYLIYNFLTLAKYLKPIKYNMFYAFFSIFITIFIPIEIPLTISNYISALPILYGLDEGLVLVAFFIFLVVLMLEFFIILFSLGWLFKKFEKKRRP